MSEIPRERWDRINEVFAGAMDLPPSEVERYLDRECGDDAELRSVVMSLLESDAKATGKLGESAISMASPLGAVGSIATDPDVTLQPGTRVGTWEIVRELGRGGMGAVYLAKRADGAFEQQVALKLVKRGMDTDEVLERFRHERQILASLEHPAIARLIDGGATDDGRPFLAMELVDGEAIDRYCDGKRMDVDSRLRLFLAVADAVSHAHANLVVHRDLKPSNILVTADGQPKLLDFGVAKLLDDSGSADATRTEAGLRMLTPGYAAPEQIRGDAVTTAIDVYSLGVVLYELLAGRRPFVSRRDPDNDEATKPSLAATSPKLSRRLRGDLDTILLKALASEPSRRYRSVQEFADDIDRHLTGKPVTARPDSVWYTGRKFVRRNLVPVSAAAILLVALSGFALAMRNEQRETAVERDRAATERDKAEELVTFMTGMLGQADPAQARGDTLNIYQVLERSEGRMDSALSGQPEVHARMLHVIGGVYRGLGEYNRAELLLDRALRMRRQLLGSQHPDVAETLHELASVLNLKADRKRAEVLFTEALAIRRAAFGDSHESVAITMHGLGIVHYWNGDYEKAAEIMKQADSVHRRANSDSVLLAANTSDIGEAYRALRRYDDAEPYIREGLAIRRAKLGAEHPLSVASMSVLSILLRDKGDLATAEQFSREALGIRKKILGEEHPDYAKSVIGLAYILDRQKKFTEAEPLFRQALAINLSKHGPEHPEVGLDMNALAKVLFSQGRMNESEELFRKSLAVLLKALGKEHPRVTNPQVGLGNLLVATGRSSQALPLLREALAVRLKEFGPEHNLTVEAKTALANAEEAAKSGG